MALLRGELRRRWVIHCHAADIASHYHELPPAAAEGSVAAHFGLRFHYRFPLERALAFRSIIAILRLLRHTLSGCRHRYTSRLQQALFIMPMPRHAPAGSFSHFLYGLMSVDGVSSITRHRRCAPIDTGEHERLSIARAPPRDTVIAR